MTRRGVWRAVGLGFLAVYEFVAGLHFSDLVILAATAKWTLWYQILFGVLISQTWPAIHIYASFGYFPTLIIIGFALILTMTVLWVLSRRRPDRV
ncbi:MAG: hypothetical protein EBZ69_03370 [Alphaproteobacteria bacterium]|nr:hypothetical protein [Alphaproteobacteria bacterium]NDC55841.1 hypothetical protein [Alphaproteobacteria bacterium]NDG19705.1 hypothetical protein [Betaproteobacteria bacterium]